MNDANKVQWLEEGKQLMATINTQRDAEMWNIGDWLVDGADKYALHDEEVKKYAEKVTGKSWKTLNNYKVVSRAFVLSRRRENLSWSLYPLLTKFDEADQDKALNVAEKIQASRKEPLSVRDFKKEIERQQAMDELPKGNEASNGSINNDQPADDSIEVPIEIKMNKEFFDFIDKLSVARYGKSDPKTFLLELTAQCLAENKDSLKYALEHEPETLKSGRRVPVAQPTTEEAAAPVPTSDLAIAA